MAYNERELLRLIPRVLRARDFHLYLEGGKRLVDLWRQGGRAVLGHKRPHVLEELKNAAERGLFCAYPHPMERRFIKALEVFFPGRKFRLYLDSGALYRAYGNHRTEGSHPCKWRPLLDMPQVETPVIIPVLPWPLGPEVLVLDKSVEASFPAGDLIPPVLLAPAARALYDLAAVIKNKPLIRYPKIEKVLGSSKEEKSAEEKPAACRWRRRGIYLTTEAEGEEYAALFRNFLEGGFLIPPSPEEPAILPLSMSPGEESKLAELLRL